MFYVAFYSTLGFLGCALNLTPGGMGVNFNWGRETDFRHLFY